MARDQRTARGLLVAVLAASLLSATTPSTRTYRYVASGAGYSAFERAVQGVGTPAGHVAASGIVYVTARTGRLTFRIDDAAATRAVPGRQTVLPVSVHVQGHKARFHCLASGQIVSLRGLRPGSEAWIYLQPWPAHCGGLGTAGATAGTITVYR